MLEFDYIDGYIYIGCLGANAHGPLGAQVATTDTAGGFAPVITSQSCSEHPHHSLNHDHDHNVKTVSM